TCATYTSGTPRRVWLGTRWELSQMNKLENPNEPENTSAEAEKPARRRSRRATRPAMAPDAPEATQAPAEAPKKTEPKKDLDILAELGDEDAGRKKEVAPAKAEKPKGDLSLDDLVLPERE